MIKSIPLLIAVMLTSFIALADEISIAKAALRDGLWDVARSHAAKIPGVEGHAIILESYTSEGKWDKVKESLNDWGPLEGDLYDYYRAALDGDIAKATFLMKKTGVASAICEADMLQASMLVKNGKRTEAEAIWKKMVASTNASERAFVFAAVNLGDVVALSNACERATRDDLRNMASLRLGTTLLKKSGSEIEGERIICKLVKDFPDVDGALDAYEAIVDSQIARGLWTNASETIHELLETWPDALKLAKVQSDRGWILSKLGKYEDALAAFSSAVKLGSDEECIAMDMLKEGDMLSELGKGDEAMSRYRQVLKMYPKTKASGKLKQIVDLRELEDKGRDAYRQYRFADAMHAFEQVANRDASRKQRMDYFIVLCLYGQGLDSDARKRAEALLSSAVDPWVRSQMKLWMAKFLFNRGEWKLSGKYFLEYAKDNPASKDTREAKLWSARAAFAEGNLTNAVSIASDVVGNDVDVTIRTQALLLQGKSLIELSRFDEALLVLERVLAVAKANEEDVRQAKMLMADALFAMGADNPQRYEAALEAYRSIRIGCNLDLSEQLLVDFKIGRTLDKLKRDDEAVDQLYGQVVQAYCRAREKGQNVDDDAKAAFSKAAFWLADEFESRGKERQTVNILRIVEASDVPAAAEAAKRIGRITKKGGVM